jgi:8-oxo-dGTP diphosphatase
LNNEEIIAAGGIIWKNTGSDIEVLTVKRTKYDDWSLPKGKLEKYESIKECAVREVKEETGCEAAILSDAGQVQYKVKGRPKRVYFFNMELKAQECFAPNEEIKEIRWMNIKEISQMTYEREIKLIMNNIKSSSVQKPKLEETK